MRRVEATPEQIRAMVAARRDFSAEQRTIISGAFEIAERSLREILVPRRDVLTLATGTPARTALDALIDAGHSRAPVVGPAGLDDVAGIVHLRDLAGDDKADEPVDALVHPVLFLLGMAKVSDALRQLRLERQQFALVVDEGGAVEGIVTMEDLVEEIVGEIYDETDRDAQPVVEEPDGALLLPGSYPIHELPGIGFSGADGDYTTIAGLLLAELGHIPTGPGEVVRRHGFTAEVEEVTGRAITRVRLRATAGAV